MVGEVIVTSKQTDIRFDVPLYTVAEAARALGVHPSTLSTWAKGYVRHPSGKQPVRSEAIVTSMTSRRGQASIPFVGLAEAMVLAGIRKSRCAPSACPASIGECSRRRSGLNMLWRRNVFLRTEPKISSIMQMCWPAKRQKAVRELVVVRSGQRVFVEIVDQYLKLISYGEDGYASQIRLPAFEQGANRC